MTNIELVQNLMRELDSLRLQGVRDFEIAVQMVQELIALKKALEAEQKAAQERETARVEQLRAEREKALREAAERGEEIVGGETVRIHADGTQEVLVP